MRILNVAPHRVVVGGLIGLLVYSVNAVTTLIRFVFNPYVAERATTGSLIAMLLFLLLFIAAGGLAGYLWLVQVLLLRYVSVGALVGALVWSYLTVTWPLTGRASAVIPPQTGVLRAVLIGAGFGALGGLLLFAMDAVRRWIRDNR